MRKPKRLDKPSIYYPSQEHAPAGTVFDAHSRVRPS